MLVDSQAAVKALVKCTVTSITVLNCFSNLNQLGKQNHVRIAWILGHAGVHGNEVADYLKQKYRVLSLLLQSRMPVVLAWLRTSPQIDGDLSSPEFKIALCHTFGHF